MLHLDLWKNEERYWTGSTMSTLILVTIQSIAGLFVKFLTAKDDPHPQADSDWGLLTTAKELRIISWTKSTVAPLTNSKLPSSTTTFEPSFSKILSHQDKRQNKLGLFRNRPLEININVLVLLRIDRTLVHFENVLESRATSSFYAQAQIKILILWLVLQVFDSLWIVRHVLRKSGYGKGYVRVLTFTQLFVTITVSFKSAGTEKSLIEDRLNPTLANRREYCANIGGFV